MRSLFKKNVYLGIFQLLYFYDTWNNIKRRNFSLDTGVTDRKTVTIYLGNAKEKIHSPVLFKCLFKYLRKKLTLSNFVVRAFIDKNDI